MNGYLIDTNVLSEYNRPGNPSPGVRRWLEKTDRQAHYVSVVTLAEIQKGIELLADGKRRTQLGTWLHLELEQWFAGRMLPVDRKVAARWASLMAFCAREGRPLPVIDSLIAATAIFHDLTLVTRNVRDFEGSGVPTFNPWES